MRLAMRLPEKKPGDSGVANDIDPREGSDAEVIDLAQRNAFPVVARPAGKSDALGLVAGIAIVAGLGLVTMWSMNSARIAPSEGIGGGQQAPVLQAGQEGTDHRAGGPGVRVGQLVRRGQDVGHGAVLVRGAVGRSDGGYTSEDSRPSQ